MKYVTRAFLRDQRFGLEVEIKVDVADDVWVCPIRHSALGSGPDFVESPPGVGFGSKGGGGFLLVFFFFYVLPDLRRPRFRRPQSDG